MRIVASLKWIMLVSVITLTISSCKESIEPSATKNYISGKFENLTGHERILLQKLSARNIVTLDTLVPDADGNFEVAPEIEKLGFYRVFVANDNFFNFITQPAETLKVSAKIDDLEGSYKVEGSAESDALAEINSMMNDYVDVMDSLRTEMQNAQMRQDAQMGQAIYTAQMQMNEKAAEQTRQFIRNNSDKLAVMSAIQRFNPEQETELFEMVLRDLKPKIGDDDIYLSLAEQYEKTKRLMIGAVLPDFTSTTPQGQPLSLSQSLGKSYTLVDFWAAWCKPCRMENPVVVKAYNKYKSKGFEVLGVSLDKEKAQWLDAIKADGLPWKQVSDLQFWESPVARQFNIQSIPANFLIDGEMRIIAKNLRGAELEAILAEKLVN
jgi:peroxiredoxin